jgi:hypothetical protein
MENRGETAILSDIGCILLEINNLYKIKRPPQLRWAMFRFRKNLTLQASPNGWRPIIIGVLVVSKAKSRHSCLGLAVL